MNREDDLGHGDIEAALATRRELGARYDAELVDGFAERIERAVERRVSEEVALRQRRTAGAEGGRLRQFQGAALCSQKVCFPFVFRQQES